jgi:hypothetical protein
VAIRLLGTEPVNRLTVDHCYCCWARLVLLGWLRARQALGMHRRVESGRVEVK